MRDLKPVNPNLALLALCWRLIETSIFVVSTLSSHNVQRLVSGLDYLRAFEADRLQALTMPSVGAYGSGYNALLMFFGLGSAMFSYLFFRSDYIRGYWAAGACFVCTRREMYFRVRRFSPPRDSLDP